LIKAGNPLQGIATGLYRTDLFLYSQKEFLAMSYPFLPSSLARRKGERSIHCKKKSEDYLPQERRSIEYVVRPQNV